jgi:hypothetical protein
VRLRFRELALALVVLTLSSYAWMYSAVSVPNERTRLYLTVALVDEGSLAIDAQLKRFGRVFDLAKFDGHYYTDKAPGSSLLAAPIYAVARRVHGPGEFRIEELINLVRTWLMLPMALAGFLLLRALLRRLSTQEAAIDVASLGFALGTVAFHYGTAFYGHVLVSTLLLASLWFLARAGLFDSAPVSPRTYYGNVLGAGLSAGLMGLTEYQAIAVAALLAVVFAFAPRPHRLKGLLAYALGGLPFAAILLVYNAHAFGGPFELSYHHLASKQLQDLHGFGLAGATVPTWEAFSGVLFSEHRGLVTTSPLMGLGLVALVTERKQFARALWLAIVLAVLYFVLIVSASSVWFGGWSFGPRLLVPITPLLALAAARLLHARDHVVLRGFAAASVVFAIVYHGFVQLTFAELPPSLTRPVADLARPLIQANLVAPNLPCKLGQLGSLTLWPALILMIGVAAYVATRGREQNTRVLAMRASASLTIAGIAVLFLWVQPPSNDDKSRKKWIERVQGFETRETSCHEVESG